MQMPSSCRLSCHVSPPPRCNIPMNAQLSLTWVILDQVLHLLVPQGLACEDEGDHRSAPNPGDELVDGVAPNGEGPRGCDNGDEGIVIGINTHAADASVADSAIDEIWERGDIMHVLCSNIVLKPHLGASGFSKRD